MRGSKILIALFAANLLTCNIPLFAEQKAVLNGNRTVTYTKTPPNVDHLSELLSKALFYGRLRMNTFIFKWKDEVAGVRKDNWAAAFGGSILCKSASFKGVSAAAALYTSQNPWHMSSGDVVYLKAGKDATSRYAVLSGDGWGMSTLAQAYLQYRRESFEFRAGRQLFETLLTASNDTKMIPNAFEGYSFTASIAGGTLKGGYLTKQKLRDHTSFHHILAYGDDPADPYAKYRENDDSAMHRGLTLSKLSSNGIDDRLIVAQYDRSREKSRLLLNYTAVPELLSYAALELGYKFAAAGMSVAPAFRYLRQFDEGAGAIGGANLKNSTEGYKNPDSLDGALYALRVDLGKGAFRTRVGYSKTADKADIVAPWRGFPTGGFTRAMGQYNWYANTKSYMVRFDYDFGKGGYVPGLKCALRYVLQDFDDKKPGVQADSEVLNFDAIEKFDSIAGLELRFRAAISYGKSQSFPVPKADPSYSDVRFEMNYLF